MRTILFEAEDTIFNQGDPSDQSYRIIAGSVDIVIKGCDGQMRKVAAIGPDEVFGEMGIIDPAPRSATAIAREPTCCEVYTGDEFLELMQDDPERAMGFLRSLVLRLRAANRKLASKNAPKPPRKPWPTG